MTPELETLRSALQRIIDTEPGYHEGTCYYEMRDGNGEYLGVQPEDPISVIQEMVRIAREALGQV